MAGVQRPTPLRRTLRIGSATTPVNYGLDDQVFGAEDMPAPARAARRELRREKRAIVLGANKQSWDTSTALANAPLCKRQSRVLQAHDRPQYKYNYRAEKLPEAAPIEVTDVVRQQFRSTMRTTTRMAHVPTHPDLADKPRWDGSTQLLEKEHAERESKVNLAATRNTRRHVQELKDYKGPVALEKEFMQTRRKLRAKGLRDVGASTVAPKDTDRGRGPATAATPASYTQTVSRKFHKYRHSGTYEESKFDGPGVFAWSCCMASDKMARGCIVTTVNPDAYNFASIN